MFKVIDKNTNYYIFINILSTSLSVFKVNIKSIKPTSFDLIWRRSGDFILIFEHVQQKLQVDS